MNSIEISEFYSDIIESAEKSTPDQWPGQFVKGVKDVVIGIDNIEPYKNKKFALFPIPPHLFIPGSLASTYCVIYETGDLLGNVTTEEVNRLKKLKQ